MSDFDPIAREQVAGEKRRWVRLTYVCNNRCRFCLDRPVHDGRKRPLDGLRRELREGIEQGCQRLVLSGGEPTLHPDFIELVSEGKRLGYRWIQAVSNGRMFAYSKFARQAAAAGLCEVTFSMHGHTHELHDHLVGVKGAFEQSLRGMANLQRTGRVVVNVDVVINALNIPHLPRMVDFFIQRGVREFDLLWLVPFGRAWDNRRELFVDPRTSNGPLREAIDLALREGAVVWTNRLPPALLEGHETLIQDPHKLHDEVRGRREHFQLLLEQGRALPCKAPERCRQCFMDGFCSRLEELVAQLRSGRLPAIRIDLDAAGGRPRPGLLIQADRLRIKTGRIEPVAEWLSGLSGSARQPAELELELSAPCEHDPFAFDFGPGVRLIRVASADPAALDAMLDLPGGELEVILNRATTGWIEERSAAVRGQLGRLLFSLQPFATLAQLDDQGIDPAEAFRPLAGSRARLLNLPVCLLPSGRPVLEQDGLDWCALGRKTINLEGFTEHYIRNDYSVYALDCADCAVREGCPGLPVNYARRFGLGLLRPHGRRDGSIDEGEDLCGLHVAEDGQASVVIRTGCSNACTFCTTRIISLENNAGWEVDGKDRILRTLEQVRLRGGRSLRLVAIEPLEHPDILEVLRRSTDLGFESTEVWSHGGPLADGRFARAALEAGMTGLDVPVFGPGPETHDRIAGREGAFHETREGLANLRRLGFERISSHMVVARGNHRLILQTLKTCSANAFGPVASIVIAAPSSADPERYRPVAPSLAEMAEGLAEYRDQVSEQFFSQALERLVSVVPQCVLSNRFPDQSWLADGKPGSTMQHNEIRIRFYSELGDGGRDTCGYDFKQRVACPKSSRCRLSDVCCGTFPIYLELFGDDELIPG